MHDQTLSDYKHRVVESLPCPIYLFHATEKQYVYEYANTHFLKLLHITKLQLQENPDLFVDFISNDDGVNPQQVREHYLPNNIPFNWVGRVTIDDRPFWFHIDAEPQVYENTVEWTVHVQDVTDQKYAERVLNETETRLQGLLDNLETVAVQGYTMDGTVVYWNRGAENIYGYSIEEALGSNLIEIIIPPEGRERVKQELITMSTTGKPMPSGDLDLMRKDGSIVSVASSHSLVERPGHGPEMFCIDTDLTRIKNTQKELLRAQRIGQVGTWKVDLRTQIVTGSPEFHRLMGIRPEMQDNLHISDIANHIYANDYHRFKEYWKKVCAGESLTFEARVKHDNGKTWLRSINEFDEYLNDEPITVLGTLQNITEEKQHSLYLEKIAYTDYLTELPNRYSFEQQTKKSIKNNNDILCIHYVDIDGLNDINTRMSNVTGDEVICTVAARLKEYTQDYGYLFCMGGGKFGIVIENLNSLDIIERDVNLIQELVSEPMRLAKDTLYITVCIGTVYTVNGQEQHVSFLFRTAENALYQAKLKGNNKHTCFSIQKYYMDTKFQIKLENIREGLIEEQFFLCYQPKVNIVTNEIIGVEALIRWHHPQEGVMGPGTFLPYIEGHPLIVEVGDWVIREAIRQQYEWKKQGFHIPVSANISSIQLEHPRFVEKLESVMREFNSDDVDLELEILESGPLLNLEEATEKFEEVKQLGITISLDDFGTGQSSLQFLKTIRPDVIKIDRSFIINLAHDIESQTIVQAILDLGKRFNARVIAEGLETPQNRDLLIELGCIYAQGHITSKPMNGSDVIEWLQSR